MQLNFGPTQAQPWATYAPVITMTYNVVSQKQDKKPDGGKKSKIQRVSPFWVERRGHSLRMR